jgi:hypothetical protein
VVPDWRYMEKMWLPVETDVVPLVRTALVSRFQI